MSVDRRADREQYGEKKERYTFMLTKTASAKLDILAESMKLTRSEVFEQAIRKTGIAPAKEDIEPEIPEDVEVIEPEEVIEDIEVVEPEPKLEPEVNQKLPVNPTKKPQSKPPKRSVLSEVKSLSKKLVTS